jgi:lysozyme
MDDAIDMAAVLARRFEGFYSRPYMCPAGVATIGYGATRYEDGSAVRLTDAPVSRERAEDMLAWELRRVCLPAVLRWCPEADTPGRVAALVDFTFNVGQGALRNSTLRRRVNARRWEDVPTELRKWVKGGGRVLPGLVRRREAEIALI